MSLPSWLSGARSAPSAHNTQPWHFVPVGPLADGRVAVRWKAQRTLPVADPTSRDLFISLGAAVESACLRALAEGTPLRFEAAPDDAVAERTVGWLTPDDAAGQPDPADLALAAVLDRRQTARGPHLPGPVPADVRDSLAAEAVRCGRRLQIATDRPTIHALAKLAGQATALLFADEGVHRELWQWLRLDPADPAYQRDGLTADCLELSGAALWLARQLMPPARMRWLSRTGLHAVLAGDTARVARDSAAICLLSAPALDPATLVETGRVLQRLWLLAATAGLTTHPLSALLDRPETAGQVSVLFGEEAFPAAIFRLGYSSPAARSPRLPLDQLWLAGPVPHD
jgi:hypothetical protein